MDWQNLFNNGVAIGVLIYFMWFQQTAMKEFTSTLTELKEVVLEVKVYLEGKNK